MVLKYRGEAFRLYHPVVGRKFLIAILRLTPLWFVSALGLAQCPAQLYNVPTRVFEVIPPRPGTTQMLTNPLLPNAPPVLTVVALGDSVVWGNGLKNPNIHCGNALWRRRGAEAATLRGSFVPGKIT